jgi:hypothetical protein
VHYGCTLGTNTSAPRNFGRDKPNGINPASDGISSPEVWKTAAMIPGARKSRRPQPLNRPTRRAEERLSHSAAPSFLGHRFLGGRNPSEKRVVDEST